MGVMSAACQLTDIKDNQAAKKTDGSKSKAIRGIPKLIDANLAGTSQSNLCTIIFCEGDSAKAGIISGLTKSDRDYIGVYPMKGKLFNVRGEGVKRIGENKEIIEIKQILGFETKYTIEHAINDLKYAFENKLLIDSLNNDLYFNIKRMNNLKMIVTSFFQNT